jgi:nucleoside 2-deoxyribosyltransferase
MRRILSVYLSGPDAYHADGDALVADKKALCLAAGFTPVGPDAGDLTEEEPSEAMAREIYAQRVSRLKEADAVVVNLTPFRGPGCDQAAAFEAGVMSGMGKPVFAYMNVRSEEEAELSSRVEAFEGASVGDDLVWRDATGYEIEDFGLPESLMLWAEARRLYVIVTPEPHHDLTGLQLCLEAIKLYSD